MDNNDNVICFNFAIDLRDNKNPDAWDRILDTFLEAVDKEGGGAGGGMHKIGTNFYCDYCWEVHMEKVFGERP